MEKRTFSCPLCNRVFKLKHHLKAHLQKKKPCITKKGKYSKKKKISKETPKIFNDHSKLSDCNNSIENDSIFILNRHVCEFCNRSYKHRFSLNKHFKRCQKKKEKEDAEKELLEAKIKIKELEMKNKQLLLNTHTTNNNTTNNNNNNKINTTTNNNCHNNTVNLIFNDYGNENIEALKNIKYKKLIAQILGNGMGGLQKYIKYKYCNPELPENLTIKYTNDRSDKLKIRKNNKWKTRDKNEVLDELYDRDTNIEEVLNVYEHINDLEDGEEMDELQEHFVDEIHKFYNDEDVDADVDKEVEEEMKRIKKITLNDFYDCYKQNKVKFDLKSIN